MTVIELHRLDLWQLKTKKKNVLSLFIWEMEFILHAPIKEWIKKIETIIFNILN